MLLSILTEGLERAAKFIAGAGDVEDITGYPKPLLDRILAVNRYGELTLLNYRDAAPYILREGGLEWTPFLRVCRGLVLDRRGAILSFPFHKFFNLNEHEETSEQKVMRWQIKTVTEKVDGVMIQVFKCGSELVYASRHGIWSNAAKTAFELAPPPAFAPILKQIPFPRWTIVCELIHPEHRYKGMLNYGDLRALVLLAVRNLETLELISAVELFSDTPNPFLLPTTYTHDFWHLRSYIRDYPNFDFEGVVLQGAEEKGNLLVKMKTTAYIERVRALKNITPRKLLEVYKGFGIEGVDALIGGLEEFLEEDIKNLRVQLKAKENMMVEQLNRFASKDVSEIPPQFRFVKTYEPYSQKWLQVLRNLVVSEIKKELQGNERTPAN